MSYTADLRAQREKLALDDGVGDRTAARICQRFDQARHRR